MVKLVRQSLFRYTVVIVCLITLGLVAPSHIAHANEGCYDYQIASNSTTSNGFTLNVYIYGSYDLGTYCGQMYAKATLYTPPHGVDGYLDVYLETCNSHAAGSASTSAPTGGLYGIYSSISTSYTILSCGSAAAVFQGSYFDPISIYVGTDNING